MYTIEEFDKEKTKVLKYILYKKRSENEVRTKFSGTIDENLLEDIIEYFKEAGYISDSEYIERAVNEYMALKNLSIKEIKYKLYSKGINKKTAIKLFENSSAVYIAFIPDGYSGKLAINESELKEMFVLMQFE